METVTGTDGSVAAPVPTGSGATRSYRTTPCTVAPVLSAPVAGETPIVIHEDEAGGTGGIGENPPKKHTLNIPSIFAAMRILEEHGYEAYKITTRNGTQASIIATKGREELMIAIIHSRKPVPDAKTLHSLFPEKVELLCAYAKTSRYRLMAWMNTGRSIRPSRLKTAESILAWLLRRRAP